MLQRKVTAFRIDADLLQAMQRLQERDGISYSEQIRRALRPWLESKDVLTPRGIDGIRAAFVPAGKKAASKPKRNRQSIARNK